MTTSDLAGKLVLVTGGAKNVGKVIAQRFAARGARVIINFFHSLDESKKTLQQMRAQGYSVECIRASVAQKSQVDRMFDEIEARYGRLDILVNNAASGALLSTDEITEEHFDRALNTNLKGAFWCARRAAALMARNGGGAIVNVSSAGAGLVPANYLVVGTSKAALESLTRYLAVDFAAQKIRVNTASATLIEGDVAQMFPDADNTIRSSIAATPLKRLAQAEDLADLVVFLASDQARWITGQTILADGGLSLCHEALSPRAQWSTPAQTPVVGDADSAESIKVLPPADAQAASTPAASSDAKPVNGSTYTPAEPAPVKQAPPEQAPDAAPLEDTDDIAIVGMGLALPGANDPEAFWRALMEGPELFGNVPPERWDFRSFYHQDPLAQDKSYQSKSVFIDGFAAVPRLQAELDAGTAPAELTTLWLRHSLMQALEGVKVRKADRTSFLVGYTADGSQHLEEAMVLAGARARLQQALSQADVSTAEAEHCLEQMDAQLRRRYERGAQGLAEFFPHRVGLDAMAGVLPADAEYVMVDTACSSSLYSVDLGIKGLLLGKHDLVACGGAFALAPRGSVLFSKLHGLSKSGEVRPLDKNCDGVLFSDGAGVVILKRLSRALADGDNVLAVIKAFGSSSDGKGKAIYAPNSAGQNIAIARAYAQPGVAIKDIDWVIAHATGTPAGDLAEFQSLRQMIVSDRKVQLTSNKSLVGHTGWAAGVTSLIQVLLALRHNCIPPQHRFSETPAEFDIASSSLSIPTQPVPWTRKPDAARTAAVSGFGFGGTNGHLVVAEYRADLAPSPARNRQPDEPLVIVGWSAKFPGLADADAVSAWLREQGLAPEASFGEVYPLPPFERVRMPPAVLRALDRCQLMALDAAHDLRAQMRDFWDSHANSIGVVMGHMGPTRNAALYASRCYLDDISLSLNAKADANSALIQQALAGLRKATEHLVAPSTENSFPGMMPNVIPARVANYYDLHGLNITLDAGQASTLAAFEAAGRYLRCGELDMVIVGGINGNTAAEISPAFSAALAEGLVLFAVMTQAGATAAGLPVLARVDSLSTQAAQVALSQTEPPLVRDRSGQVVSYLGADGAVAILRALVQQQPLQLSLKNVGDCARFALQVSPSVKAPAPSQSLPPSLWSTQQTAQGSALGVNRYTIELADTPWQQGAEPIAFLPPQCLLLTDHPELLTELGPLPSDLCVVSTQPLVQPKPGWLHISALSETALAEQVPLSCRHLRVLTRLDASALPAGQLAPAAPQLLQLHSLIFLGLKHCYKALAQGGSFISLLLDGVTRASGKVQLHPNGGLFAGLVKAMAVELPVCRSLAVFTDSRQALQGRAQAERETAAQQLLPVVALSGTQRLTTRVTAAAGELRADGMAKLTGDAVIVAFGGARGITAELLKALALQHQPKLYVLGSSDLSQLNALEEIAPRPVYIREQKALHPHLTLPQINKNFDRLLDARTAQANLAKMQEACGADRVTYLRADITDAASVTAAVAQILAQETQVDLLINAPGLNRSASVQVKSLADFVAVRDIKVRGYWHLRAAFGERQPQAWCNFGSFIGLTGQAGETDYAAANDFLNSQAAYQQATLGAEEFTIGWTLWREVGLGSNAVTRAFLEKSGLFTSMTTEEGVHHFLRELNLVKRDANSVHLGAPERAAILDHLPQFFSLPKQAAIPTATPGVCEDGFYLGKTLQHTAQQAVFERVFDLERDAYLQHHVVNGFATLPGTFVPEIAAEAALKLVPGLKVVGFEDVVFHHFLRVYDPQRPSVKKVHAQVLSRDSDLVLVQVRVTGDVLAPGGQVLVRDKLHFEIKARLAPDYPVAPVWPAWPQQPHTPIADPYHMPAAPVYLSDMFVSTTQTCSTPLGKRARYQLNLKPQDPVFSRFVVPSIMLDGLARVAVLNTVAEDYIPLAAPAAIRRIDIYEAGNDPELAARYAQIDLYATPREFALEGAGIRNRFVAARPDGGMIMQMKDVTGVVIGYVHRSSGEFMAKEAVESLLAPRPVWQGAEA